MESLEQRMALVDELETVLKQHRVAATNPSAIQRLRSICCQITAEDDYLAEKCTELMGLAACFYSPAKHRTHPGGAEAIYSRMTLDLLNRIRSRVRELNRH